MDPNAVHRQFLPGYTDPTGWSSILYSYGGQGPAGSQLHDLRAEQQRAISENQRQISGHEIAEFFARTAVGQAPNNILNECHIQPQPPQQHVETSTAHDVVLDLGLNACVSNKKSDKVELSFIQDAIERSKFDKRRIKGLKTSLKAWYKRTGCVTVALTYHDGQISVSGPDHMLSLEGNQEFKNIFMNTLTSYDQLSRLADIVSNCNEGDNGTDTIDAGPIQTEDIAPGGVIESIEQGIGDFTQAKPRQPKKTNLQPAESALFDQVCKFCPEKFSSKHFLKKHMFEVHNSSAERLTCPFCSKQFMTRWKLDRHTISHTGAKPYNCIYCPKRFAEKNKLICHVKCHKESFVDPQAVDRLINSLLPKRKTSHDCMICEKTFLSSWKLKRHIRVHSGEKPYKCTKCPKSFIEKSKLDAHMLLPHDGSGRIRDGSCLERKHHCDQCDKKFISLWKLRRHSLFHSGERPFQCEQCDKGFVEKNKLTMHIKYYHSDKNTPESLRRIVNRAKKYECDDCDKKFATQWKLRRHSQTHSVERPFRCAACKRGFLTKNKLDLHNFTYHNQEAGSDNENKDKSIKISKEEAVEGDTADPLTVPEQNESHIVIQHEALILPGMAPNKLEAQNSGSEQDVEAAIDFSPDRHAEDKSILSLTVSDPTVIASDNGASFANDQEVKITNQQKKLHKCKLCDKEFATGFRLKRHSMTHAEKSYGCTVCSQEFSNKGSLMSHIINHGVEGTPTVSETATNESPAGQSSGKHVCRYCDKRFVSPWKLKRHVTVHTGQKPFFCKLCNKAFTEKNKLENHFKLTHPGDLTLLEEELAQQEVTMANQDSSFSIVASATVAVPLQDAVKIDTEKDTSESVNIISTPLTALQELKCPVCNEVFSTGDELNSHIHILHDEKRVENSSGKVETDAISSESKKALKYICQVCYKGFITPSKLKRHGFSHGEQKPFKCKKCNKRFSENNKLFNHLMTHDKPKSPKIGSNGKLKIELLGKIPSLQSMPISVEALKPKIMPINAIISSTSKSATEQDATKSINPTAEHQEIKYAGQKKTQQGENIVTAKAPVALLDAKGSTAANSNSPFVIVSREVERSNSEQLKSLVDKALSSSALQNVVNSTSGIEVKTELINPDLESSRSPGTSVADQKIRCDKCQESFTTQLNLKQHNLIHHPPDHEMITVDARPPEAVQDNLKHRCTECNRGFKTPSKLKRHSLMHTGEKPFHCHLCPKQFKRKDTLVKHIDEHSRAGK